MRKFLILVCTLVAFSMAGTLKDARDGKTYKTVQIGNQVWMAENLNYKTSESFCYGNKVGNCKKYGRLYTWDDAKKACPAGWRLPSVVDFKTLLTAMGTSGEERSQNLRAGTWNNGSDMFGFSALPAGFYISSNRTFVELDTAAFFWSSTGSVKEKARHLSISGNGAYVGYDGKGDGASVRCFRDSDEGSEVTSQRSEAQPSSETTDKITDARDGKIYRTVQIGNQTWMAENLNYQIGKSKCYDDEPENCDKYGRLYTWDDAKKACPAGWRLPNRNDFKILLAAVGTSDKENSSNLRIGSWENGVDKFGFSALPAGFHFTSYGDDDGLGEVAFLWSSTKGDEGYDAYYLRINDSFAGVDSRYTDDENSVRCLQDSNEGGEVSSSRSEAQSSSETTDKITDARDGKTYKTVKMPDGKVWMAENLNYQIGESKCYDDKPENCEKYGRLYTWDDAKKACPAGWRLPSKAEFESLLSTVGTSDKESSSNLRIGSWGNGSDKFGFSALPAGRYSSYYREFGDLGYGSYFWTSTEYNSSDAYNLDVSDTDAGVVGYYDKGNGNSVRCLQDSNEGGEASSQRSEAQPPSGTLKDSRDGQTYKTVQIGNQTWMAENLNYKAGESKCYDNKESNCKKYGRLYTWEAAKMACPSGWHLPSREEFDSFLATVGASSEDQSENLRAGSWKNGKDKYGFSALPAGYYNSYGKKFRYLGYHAYFWASTERHSYYAYILSVGDGDAYVIDGDKDDWNSVRCLQDN